MQRVARWLSKHVARDQHGPIPARRRLEIVGWSTLRYAVFTGQYLWMLAAFDVEERAAAVAVVWLVNAAVPTGALAEFGVREASALAVMQPAGAAVAGVRGGRDAPAGRASQQDGDRQMPYPSARQYSRLRLRPGF